MARKVINVYVLDQKRQYFRSFLLEPFNEVNGECNFTWIKLSLFIFFYIFNSRLFDNLSGIDYHIAALKAFI